jgi:hypothetical protein
MILCPYFIRVVPNRVVEEAGFNPTSQERFFAGPVASSARTIGPVVEFFGTFVEGFNDYCVASRSIQATGARGVITSVRIGKSSGVCVIVVVVVVGVKSWRWGTISDVLAKKGRQCGVRTPTMGRGQRRDRGRARCEMEAAT